MSIPRVPNRPSADLIRRQADAINRTLKNTNGLSSSETSIASDRDFDIDGVLKIAGTQVVGAQGLAVPDLTVTATSGTLPTPNGSVTIANAAAPTVTELLEYCRELEAKVETLLARLRAHGLIAT